MILYHGTIAPEELVRSEGLRVFTPDSLRDYLLRIMGTPKKLVRTIGRAIKEGFELAEPGILCFDTSFEEAKHYTSSPSELFEAVTSQLPEDLWFELDRRIGTIGKVVEVDVPDEWLDHSEVEVLMGEGHHEVRIPWDIGPQYIKRIILV